MAAMLRAGCGLARALGRGRTLPGASEGARRWLRSSTPAGQDEGAALSDAASKEAFISRWTEVAPSTLPPPLTPADIFPGKAQAPEAGAAVPEKLRLNFYLPHDVAAEGEEVDLVLVPAVTGDFGVMPGHVPTIAQLRPGVVSVHKELDKDVQKWFVSSGFAFVHEDSSTDVCAVEAVPLEDLDPEAVKAGLAEYTAKLASASSSGDDYEAAAAQVGVEVYSAMNAALGN